jgi:hypothetical protein
VCRLCGDGSGHSNHKYKIFSLKMTIYLLYKIGHLFWPDMAIMKLTASHSCMGLRSWTLHVHMVESNENLKSAIKIRNTARLPCKLAAMILMVLENGWQVAVWCRNATRWCNSRVKTAAPLATCTEEQQRSERVKPHGNSSTNESSVRWCMSVTTA